MMEYKDIIGRKGEIEILEHCIQSKQSEYLAVYGRLHVGKSYLVNQVCGADIVFQTCGLCLKEEDVSADACCQEQLKLFYASLLTYGLSNSTPQPSSWTEAFELLKALMLSNTAKRKVIFLDELPWLAGADTEEFLAALGSFWHYFAVPQHNIVLVVSGSAVRWMLNNIIQGFQDLHRHITFYIHLRPFSLGECEQYFQKRQFHFSKKEVLLAYMAFGGLPYYLDMIRPGLALTNNLDKLFFHNPKIRQDFEDVYAGMFSSKEDAVSVVSALSEKPCGLSLSEISAALDYQNQDILKKLLENLEASDLVITTTRYGSKHKETVYQLVDFFSLFYLRYAHSFSSWAEEAFKLVAMLHQKPLARALGLGMFCECYSWKGTLPSGIDVLIDAIIESKDERTDYLLETKFVEDKNTTDDKADKLQEKVDAFTHSRKHNTRHAVKMILLTPFNIDVIFE